MNCSDFNPPCPACTARAFRPLLTVRGRQIYRCSVCGLATWDWRGVDLSGFYEEPYWKSPDVGRGYADYFALAGALTYTHRQRLRWITAALARAGGARCAVAAERPALLDAGCGPGFFVQAAQQRGFRASGVEISDYAVRFAREQLGLDVRRGQVRREDLRPGPYDVVTLWDVLEHLPDPAAALAAVAGVLRAGGLLALSTGDIASPVARLSGRRWHLFNLPEHLWFFTLSSLRRLLRRAGLQPIQQRREVCWYTLRYIVERLEAMLGSRRLVSPHLHRLGRLPVPVTLLDIVTILARKP